MKLDISKCILKKDGMKGVLGFIGPFSHRENTKKISLRCLIYIFLL